MEKAFIFDMDGVIINSEPIYHSIELAMAEQYGVPLDEKSIEKYIGMRTHEVWESIVKEEDLTLNVKDILIRLEAKKVTCIKQRDLEPVKGIVELLRELKGLNYKIALASSSSNVLIDTVLQKFDIGSYFDCIVSGEEVRQGKPAPDIYIEAASRLMTNPKCCFVLEDSKMGIESGNKAGMKTIGFINPGSGNQDLSKANIVVSTIEEIIGYLSQP